LVGLLEEEGSNLGLFFLITWSYRYPNDLLRDLMLRVSFLVPVFDVNGA